MTLMVSGYKVFLTVFKILPLDFFGNLSFAVIARIFCGNHHKYSKQSLTTFSNTSKFFKNVCNF